MTEETKVNAHLEEIKFAFHEWKHNKITQIISKYLHNFSDELTTLMLSNASRDCTNDSRLSFYYRSAAKIELITHLLNLKLEDIGDMMGESPKEGL